MKLTKKEAMREARNLKLPHIAVKTRYWSMDLWDYVECWTVVLDTRKTV